MLATRVPRRPEYRRKRTSTCADYYQRASTPHHNFYLDRLLYNLIHCYQPYFYAIDAPHSTCSGSHLGLRLGKWQSGTFPATLCNHPPLIHWLHKDRKLGMPIREHEFRNQSQFSPYLDFRCPLDRCLDLRLIFLWTSPRHRRHCQLYSVSRRWFPPTCDKYQTESQFFRKGFEHEAFLIFYRFSLATRKKYN